MDLNDLVKLAELQLISTRLEKCLCDILLPSRDDSEKCERERRAYTILNDLHNWRMTHE